MIALSFVETHRYAYPVTTTGTGTALTVAKKSGDPYLVFLTQESFDDQVVYLGLGCDVEIDRHATPPGRQTTTGLGYDLIGRRIFGAQTTSNANIVYAFDPTTEAEVLALDLSASTDPGFQPTGLATNGLFLLRTDGQEIELRTMGGFKLAQKSFPGRSIKGITSSPWSWTFVDGATDEIVVINPLGTEIASAPAPGSAGGCGAVAYNHFHAGENEPQQWICPLGTVDTIPGSIHNPDTPWDPEPWSGRHRLFVANDIDQIIYAGYLSVN
ncbi:MAG: hypothetical protein RLO50_19175 [Azospirillaceae bacterium]